MDFLRIRTFQKLENHISLSCQASISKMTLTWLNLNKVEMMRIRPPKAAQPLPTKSKMLRRGANIREVRKAVLLHLLMIPFLILAKNKLSSIQIKNLQAKNHWKVCWLSRMLNPRRHWSIKLMKSSHISKGGSNSKSKLDKIRKNRNNWRRRKPTKRKTTMLPTSLMSWSIKI